MYRCINFIFDFQISPGLKSWAANLFGVENVHSMLHAYHVVFSPYRVPGFHIMSLSTRTKTWTPTLRVGRRFAALGEPAAAACGGAEHRETRALGEAAPAGLRPA